MANEDYFCLSFGSREVSHCSIHYFIGLWKKCSRFHFVHAEFELELGWMPFYFQCSAWRVFWKICQKLSKYSMVFLYWKTCRLAIPWTEKCLREKCNFKMIDLKNCCFQCELITENKEINDPNQSSDLHTFCQHFAWLNTMKI